MSLSETRDCPDTPSCGIDCAWGDWSAWGGCSCSCGGGQRNRHRNVGRMPRSGGKPCSASDKEQVEPCNTEPCKVEKCIDGKFSDWEGWTNCSATCGGGTSTRHRKVLRTANECGREPVGMSSEVRFCNVHVPCEAPVNCSLTDWGDWTECSTSCNGMKRRFRQVGTYGRGTGDFCTGALKETWPCNPEPGEEVPRRCGEDDSVDCLFGDWKEWSDCSATCGGGEHRRSRIVVQHPSAGGRGCMGPLSEVSECARTECEGQEPVDCRYSTWSSWGACTKCSGQMMRTRHIERYPKYGGKPCDAVRTEETAKCPRKCGEKLYCTWADWESWRECTTTCGAGGRRHRQRHLHLVGALSAGKGGIEPPAPMEDLIDKYEKLFQRTRELQQHHLEELLTAFGAGCLSLLAAFTGMRGLSFLRARSLRRELQHDRSSSRLFSRGGTPPRGRPGACVAQYEQLREVEEAEVLTASPRPRSECELE